MSTQPERPNSLPRRSRPQPAPDESIDPVVPTTPAATPALEPARVPRRRQATVQLGVRVTEDLADLVAAEADRRGISQREVVETALRVQLGQKRSL